jgi:hypothetical protein
LNVYFKLSNDLRLLLARKLLNQGFLVIMLKSSFQMFYVVTMTWVTVKEYLCHKWPRIWSVCRNHNPVLSSSWLITRYVVERTTWLVSLVRQELLTILEKLEFTPTIYWGSCCSIIVFSVLLDPCLFFSPFSLTIVLSVLRTTTSDYPFGTS